MSRKHCILFIINLIVFIFQQEETSAQIFRGHIPYPAPQALLIKLPTYSTKIAIFEKANNRKYADQCRKDASGMQKAIIKDFNTDYSYCTIYYYYDTMQQQISAQRFAGVLYDKNLQPILNSPIQQGDTTYQIAYFGRYLQASAENEATYNTGSSIQRMNVVSYQLKRLPDPIPNGSIRTGVTEVWRKIFNRNTTYKSKLFDVYYIRSAKTLSEEMDKYYRGVK